MQRLQCEVVLLLYTPLIINCNSRKADKVMLINKKFLKKRSLLEAIPYEVLDLICKHLNWRSLLSLNWCAKKFYRVVKFSSIQILDLVFELFKFNLKNHNVVYRKLLYYMSTINWESESTRKDNMNIHFFPIFATFGLNGPFKALLNKFDTVTPNEDWKSYDLILNPFITAVVNNHFNIIKLLVFANKLTEYSYRWSIRIACRENNWKIFRFTMLYSSIQRKVPLLYKYDIKYLRYRLLTQAEIPRSYEIVLAARDGAYNAVKLLLSVEEIDPLVTHFGMGAISIAYKNLHFSIVKLLLSDFRVSSNLSPYSVYWECLKEK